MNKNINIKNAFENNEFPATKNALCKDWCYYKPICPLFNKEAPSTDKLSAWHALVVYSLTIPNKQKNPFINELAIKLGVTQSFNKTIIDSRKITQ